MSNAEALAAAGLPTDVTVAVAFAAHPDDVDFGAAGTIAALTEAGVSVHYVVMTAGDAGGFEDQGQEDISSTRRAEQLAAAAAVGVSDVRVWDEPDGFLTPGSDLARRVVATLRELRPQLVFCPHPERDYERLQRSHPDHLACGEIVTSAVYPALENPYAFPELQASGLTAYKLRHLWFYGAPEARENRAVDVTGQFPRKLAALRQHLSQHPDVAKMEAFVRQQLSLQAAASGLPAGALAERFHAVEVNSEHTIAGF